MNFIGNIIWLIFGGFYSFIGYMVGGLILCLTIIGIPFGVQCFKIGIMMLWPFGSKIEYSPGASGCLATIFNILWIIFGGLWVAIGHLFFGILLSITIIGIPFAHQHFKLMSLTLAPFDKRVSY